MGTSLQKPFFPALGTSAFSCIEDVLRTKCTHALIHLLHSGEASHGWVFLCGRVSLIPDARRSLGMGMLVVI